MPSPDIVPKTNVSSVSSTIVPPEEPQAAPQLPEQHEMHQEPPPPPPPQSEPFVTTFLRGVSEKSGEDFMKHAGIFNSLGMSEEKQFRNLVDSPDAMDMVKERLEKEGVTFYAISIMTGYLKRFFADFEGGLRK